MRDAGREGDSRQPEPVRLGGSTVSVPVEAGGIDREMSFAFEVKGKAKPCRCSRSSKTSTRSLRPDEAGCEETPLEIRAKRD